jgi:hypothetical protein
MNEKSEAIELNEIEKHLQLSAKSKKLKYKS